MIYCNDCIVQMRQLIAEGVKVDMVLTDIPYGTTAEPWDEVIPYKDMWECLNEISYQTTPVLLFGQEPFSSYLRMSNIKNYKYDIYWEKERFTNVMQVKRRFGKIVENISVFYRQQCTYNPQMVVYEGPKRSNKIGNGKMGDLIDNRNSQPVEYVDNGLRYPSQIVRFKRDVLTSNLHPTQKPVELLKYLINTFTNEGDTVLDFTMGSGSTCVAAKETGRKYIGIENDPKYFEIAKERLEKVKF